MLSDDCLAWKPDEEIGVRGDDRPHVHGAAVGQHHVGLEAVGPRGAVGRRVTFHTSEGTDPCAGAGSAPLPPRAPPAGGAAVASRLVLTLVAVLVGLLAGFVGARILRRPAATAGAASVGRSVGGAVGSRRELDLPHLQRSVLSEMLRHVRPERGRAAVPPEFRVRLHPDDKATVDQAPGFFRQGLEEALAKAGHEHGWDVPARVRIEIEADPARRRGVPAVDARMAAPVGSAAAGPPAARRPGPGPGPGSEMTARLVRSDGPDHVLGPVTTIGRGPGPRHPGRRHPGEPPPRGHPARRRPLDPHRRGLEQRHPAQRHPGHPDQRRSA